MLQFLRSIWWFEGFYNTVHYFMTMSVLSIEFSIVVLRGTRADGGKHSLTNNFSSRKLLAQNTACPGYTAPLENSLICDPLVGSFTPCGVSLPPPSSRKCRNFVILFMGHCGSSAFMEALENTYDIVVPGFEPLEKFVKAGRNASAALMFTEQVFAEGMRKNLTVGFKMRPWSVKKEPIGFASLVRKYDVCIAHMFRLNMLLSVVTNQREHKIGATQFDSKIDKTTKLSLSEADARQILKEVELNYAFHGPGSAARFLAYSHGTSLVKVSYENFLYNPYDTVAYVGKELNLVPRSRPLSSSKFVKRSSAILEDNLKPEALRILQKIFCGSKYAWMLINYDCVVETRSNFDR